MLSINKNHHNNAHTIFFFTLQKITILIQILSADFMFSFVSWLHVQLYLPLFCVWFQGYPLVVCLPGGYSRGGVCHSRSRNRSRWRCLCYNCKEIIVLLVKKWTCAIVIYWTLGTLKKMNILTYYAYTGIWGFCPLKFFFFKSFGNHLNIASRKNMQKLWLSMSAMKT